MKYRNSKGQFISAAQANLDERERELHYKFGLRYATRRMLIHAGDKLRQSGQFTENAQQPELMDLFYIAATWVWVK